MNKNDKDNKNMHYKFFRKAESKQAPEGNLSEKCDKNQKIAHYKFFRKAEPKQAPEGILSEKCDKNQKIEHYKFFRNSECENFPCHKSPEKEEFNCLFCYCPLYVLGEKCGGNFHYSEKGIKSCKDCSFPHHKENYDKIISRFEEIVEIMKKLPQF